MNRSNLKNLLLVAATLGSGANAFALDVALPERINVVIIDETERGWDKGVLNRYGIASRASRLSTAAQKELRQIMRDSTLRMRLVVPTACPTAGTSDTCASLQRIKDVDLPLVVDRTRHATLLVLWPEAAYYPDKQLYEAYVDVDVLQKGKLVPGGPFYLGYREWQCDTACAQAAFEASAKELSTMVRYVLELGPAAQTRSVPAAWRDKPVVSSLDKWANTCATDLAKHRVVREYGERFWLNRSPERTLVSAAWRGCNIL